MPRSGAGARRPSRESDTLVREGGGGGGDARCNVHFLVHHDRQRRRRWSTVDLDHHRTTMVGLWAAVRPPFSRAKPFSMAGAGCVSRRDLRDRRRSTSLGEDMSRSPQLPPFVRGTGRREGHRRDWRSRPGTCPSRRASPRGVRAKFLLFKKRNTDLVREIKEWQNNDMLIANCYHRKKRLLIISQKLLKDKLYEFFFTA